MTWFKKKENTWFTRLREAIVTWLIERATRTPYTHLYHPDGSAYMERYWLLRTRWISFRLHRIMDRDRDPHMHDHPWPFVSIVLRGRYIESLPKKFQGTIAPARVFFDGKHEPDYYHARETFSAAYRRAGDRHRIVWHTPGGIWTLFITGRKCREWGFHTPQGWIHWQDYPSTHGAGMVDGAAPRTER